MMGLFDSQGRRFATKKMLKEYAAHGGNKVHFEETSFFGREFKGAGEYCVVLPTPSIRKSFATVTVTDDCTLLKVS